MKKRSYVSCLGALAVAMTLVTTSLTGGTMAKYATEVTGSATATVAAWSFKANGQEATMTGIDLGSTANRASYNEGTIKEGVIAPGTKGSFEIVVDGTGSEVGIDCSIIISKDGANGLPDGFIFKVDGTSYTLGESITKKIDYDGAADAMKKPITVTWEWPNGNATASDNDNAYNDKDLTLKITVTGTQQTPTSTTENP